MIKWPGKIVPRTRNEMVSIHDIFPTLASIIRCKPMDGVDQSAFVMGKQAKSNRESLLIFIGEDLVAVRWRQYRLDPKQFVSSAGNPATLGVNGYRAEGSGYLSIFNIERDQREEVNIGADTGWVVGEYLKLIAEYQKSLEKYPNPKAVNMTQFGRALP